MTYSTGLAETFAQRFGTQHTWSGSRLEAYRTCPFLFFVGSVLKLEPRIEPAEGLDARQLGNIYHRILERLYKAVSDPTDLDQLLTTLPNVTNAVLDESPRREGFRVTAWWAHTRAEIVEKVQRSLEALAEIQEDFIPCRYEAPFGLGGEPPLVIGEGEDRLRLRGVIDRVDRAPDGRLRIIDYKTSGPSVQQEGLLRGKEDPVAPLCRGRPGCFETGRAGRGVLLARPARRAQRVHTERLPWRSAGGDGHSGGEGVGGGAGSAPRLLRASPAR
jgi:ATP-dependent helicase/DNAse subunit B